MRRHPIAFLSVFLCLITFLFSASSVSAQTSADVVLYAAGTPTKAGNWLVVADSTAASGSRLANPNASAAKLTVPLASPPNYFEMTFYAEAGKAYRLWLRGKAESNSYNNDSVYVQFSGSTTSSGAAAYLIGTTSAATVIIEDCTGCGLSGWGWQDNGYGTGVLGAAIYFAQTGQQTIRIQSREDGISIDQIVLSPSTYISSAPGALKKDATILAPNDGALPNQAPQVNITAYSEPSSTQQASASTATAVPTVQGPAPLVVHFSANASDPDGSIVAYSWDFGDSQSSQLVDPIHTYITPGSYNARLTVTDNLGVSATDILSVTVVVPTGATIFKVLGWNMHKGIGTDNVNSLSRIADYINKANADVAAVCELMDYSTTSPGKGAERSATEEKRCRLVLPLDACKSGRESRTAHPLEASF
ncbi:MAG: PKD domain-containing protein [Pyrinomonadaceae bacterium]